MTILGSVGDHRWLGGGHLMDHPWQLLPGVSFVSKVYVPNFESVVYFLLVGDHPSDVV